MKAKRPKVYRLGSNAMFNAPGMIKWAIHGAHFKRDRNKMVKIVADGWGIPRPAAVALVLQQVPYTVETSEHGGVVVFTA